MVPGGGALESTATPVLTRARADVALDARLTSHMSVGMQAYAREMVRRLPGAAPDLRFSTFEGGDNFDVAEQVSIPLQLARERPRLAHFLSPFAPLITPVPYIVTVHDLIELQFPQHVKRKGVIFFRYVLRLLLARARAVVTDDAKTVGELGRFLGVPPEKVRVVPLGVADTFRRRWPIEPSPRPYFFYAGNHRAHKDLHTLFAAWTALPPDLPADLVLTGFDDFGAALAPYHRERGNIVFAGNVDDEMLAQLYRGARAYVHPALVEGFGLPIVEAMAVGTPAIVTARAVPEVVRAQAATYPGGDAAALRALLEDALREPGRWAVRGQAGRELALELTWDACARATADVYRALLV